MRVSNFIDFRQIGPVPEMREFIKRAGRKPLGLSDVVRLSFEAKRQARYITSLYARRRAHPPAILNHPLFASNEGLTASDK